jgi:hypothetical protein
MSGFFRGAAALVLVACPAACGGRFGEASQSSPGSQDPVDAPRPVTASWIRRFGGAGDDIAKLLATRPTGEIILEGWSSSPTLDLGDGDRPHDHGDFLVELDSDGATVWSTSFQVESWTNDATFDPGGNVFLGGSARSVVFGATSIHASCGAVVYGTPAYLLKLTPDGAVAWGRNYGDCHDQSINAIVADAEGLVVAGDFTSTIDFGGGVTASAATSADHGAVGYVQDAFVAKLDGDGRGVWITTSKGSYPSGVHVTNLARTPDGGVAILGQLPGAFGGGLDAGVDFGCGVMTPTPLVVTDMFVVALNGDGACRWQRHWVTNNDVGGVARGLAVDAAGNVFAGGPLQGSTDLGTGTIGGGAYRGFFVTKLAPDGAPLWSRGFGGHADRAEADVEGLAIDATGNLLMAGSFAYDLDLGGGSLGDGRWKAFLAKLAPDGSHVWSRAFGGAGAYVEGIGVAIDAEGRAVFAGQLSQDAVTFGAPFDDVTFTPIGGVDLVVGGFGP